MPSPPPRGKPNSPPPPAPRKALSPVVYTSEAGDDSNPSADAMTTGGTPAPLPTSESSCLLAGHAWDQDKGECIAMHSTGTSSAKKDCPDGCYWNYRMNKCWPDLVVGDKPVDCSAQSTAREVSSTKHTGSVEGLVPSVLGAAAFITVLAGISIYRYKFHKATTPKQPLVDSPTSSVTFCENPIHA